MLRIFRSPRALTGAVAVLTALLLGACQRAAPTAPGSNVILVTIDTLRADHLGCYGYERATSPRIDELAARSVVFERAVSTSSWTLPAHASLLTGLYPAEHGVQTDVNAMPASAVTLAELLGEHGYQTFAAVSHVYLSTRWGFDTGFDRFDERVALGSPQRPVATHIVDSAIEWLAARDTERPFFAWLHIFDPHWDYAPPPPFDTRFDPDYRGSMRGNYASIKPYVKAVAGYDTPPPLAERDLEHLLALYDGEIAYVDTELGRLFDALGAKRLWDSTVLVVASDHGEEFMEHGSLEGHQWTLYDEVVMVPLIAHFPGPRLQGTRVGDVVSTVGAAGMVLDYLGIDNGWRSLYPLLSGGPPRGLVGGEALLDLTVRRRERQLALRTADAKLVRHDDGRTELYQLGVDPGEHEDVSVRSGDVVEALSARIDANLARMKRLPDAGVERDAIGKRVRDRLKATGYLD